MFHAQFQSFDEASESAHTVQRMAGLRALLKSRGLSGFILPRADAHQNEYVPASEERLAWLTGFTGSAGIVIVLTDRAVLFTDGRYTLQAAEQLDGKLFSIAHVAETPPDAWIGEHLPAGSRLGYDPWLHTTDATEKLARACSAAGCELVALETNPVDDIWIDRPAPPLGRIVIHDLKYTGEEVPQKLGRVRAEMANLRADALVLSDPHNTAWLFNIRGHDVPHTPLPLCFAVLPREGRPSIHVDARKLDNTVRDALEKLADIRTPDDFIADLRAMGAAGNAVRLDQATGADALTRILKAAGAKVSRGADPVTAMKAVKNATEISGARAAHRRDGAAMVRFLAWLDREAPKGGITEIAAVEALESFRRDTGLLKDVSFPSISGTGPNGAIVHYRVTRRSNRAIAPNDLFLIDSGGQYEDGTTDITRTVAVGTPTGEMRNRFTLVLKGHIAIARAVFPSGSTGAQIDSFARQHLWRHGLDFDHGTGHGVGSYLSVHEGPARISKLGTAPLKRGMILSNEPGYYKAGGYGIRIENLVLVSASPPASGGEKELDCFETLTLAPIDGRLVEPQLMTEEEIAWLDAYHALVAETLTPLLDNETRGWLAAATAPVKRRPD